MVIGSITYGVYMASILIGSLTSHWIVMIPAAVCSQPLFVYFFLAFYLIVYAAGDNGIRRCDSMDWARYYKYKTKKDKRKDNNIFDPLFTSGFL